MKFLRAQQGVPNCAIIIVGAFRGGQCNATMMTKDEGSPGLALAIALAPALALTLGPGSDVKGNSDPKYRALRQ